MAARRRFKRHLKPAPGHVMAHLGHGESRERIAELRRHGYDVKLVHTPHGTIVLKRRRRAARHSLGR